MRRQTTTRKKKLSSLYDDIKKAVKFGKRGDIVTIMGDFNGKIGRGVQGKIVDRYGVGERNDRSDRLVTFCEESAMIIMNTHLKQPERKLYTWKSPGDVRRNQIDLMLVNSRYRNMVRSSCTYPGADITYYS